MKHILLITYLLIQTAIVAQIPSNYYNSANGLSGYTLKTELKNIITNNYNSLSYGQLYSVYLTSDADNYYENDGTVLDMYSEIPSGADAYSYAQINANQCLGGVQAAEAECYNREHIVPQVAFNYQFPMKSDAHFVFPTDGFVNAERGSLPFGEVSSPIYTSLNGSKKGNNTTPGYSSYVFEPIDEFKGDIARALFYFATRYEDSVSVWSHNMFDGSSDQVFEDWFLDILLDWHTQDPVSARDINRNNVIYNNQNNANPFVNHPEYVNLIWAPTDTISPSTPTNLATSNVTSNSVVLNWTASTDNIAVEEYDIYRNGSLIANSVSNSYTDFGLSNNTNYSYYVVAKDNTPNYSINSNTVSITTLALPEYLVVDSFENACFNTIFDTYSSASSKDWECQNTFGFNNSGCMRMNGFQESVLSDDWLITSNKILFSNYNSLNFSCYLEYAFGDMSLDLIYSTNYTSGTNPALATWTAVPNVVVATSSGSGSSSVQNIINTDISAITADAHVAFRYVSTGNPTRWNVDNFSITGVLNTVPDITNPTNPTNLIASNVTSSSVDLNWSASTDNIAVTSYDVYRDGALITNVSTTNYTNNGLTQNTNYTYYVVAKDAAGNISGNSNSESITTLVIADTTNVNVHEHYFRELKIFPNPTKSNSIQIVSATNFSEVKLYSVLGELVRHNKDLKTNYLELKTLEKGIYILKISSEDKSVQRNIIVL